MALRYLGGINSPPYNPLAANVTTGVTTVQPGGIYTASSASQNIPLGQWLDDAYFNQTSLLLQADNTTNGLQNNTFLDSSTNNFTVTRNGNATQGNFSPFSNPEGYWSNYFDGTGDYLTVTGSSNLAFGSNSFTIEFFIYFTSVASAQNIYDARPTSTNGAYPVIYLDNTTGKIIYYVNTAARITSDAVVLANQWYHIAVAKNGTALRMFINGIQQGGVIFDTTTYLNGTTRPIIGASSDLVSPVVGYISNLRALNGTGLYTTNFTPPTAPLTAITNTQLLTCQSNRFVDNSTNNFAITKSGDVAIRPFSVFNNAPTFNGPTGTGSVFFKGYDNYALINQSLIPRTQQEFTIEGWIYLTGNNATLFPVLICDDAFADFNWTFGVGPSNYLGFWWRTGLNTYDSITGTTALSLNTWYYIAVSASATNVRIYVNGVMDTPFPGGLSTRLQVDNRTVIGGISNTSAAFMFQGLVSNLSVTNGVGKYTGSSFTIPTGPSPAVATGQVLLFASPFAVDSNATVAPKTVTITGAVSNNVGSPFATPPVGFPAAGGAAYFDGTGDYLTIPDNALLEPGTSNFCIECWFYANAASPGNPVITVKRATAATTGTPFIIYLTAPNTLSVGFSSTGTNFGIGIASIGNAALNAWNHVAAYRLGNAWYGALNGVVTVINASNSGTLNNNANALVVGGDTNTNYFIGYISNFRYVIGSSVYTASNFTPPTAPLVPIANTQLLLNNTNAGISDGTNINTFETVGNAQVSTAIKKYGSGSMFFDGTGDWLLIPDNFELRMGTGNFTVEAWVYVSSFAAARSIIGKGTSTTGWFFYVATTGRLAFGYDSATLNGNNALVLNTWNHVAVVRFGALASNVRMYINGNLDVASTSAITQNFNQTNPMYVGADRTATNPYLGYIDDLRVTKNFARYTSNFVPPTVALPRMG
jgi:hypothetical protein